MGEALHEVIWFVIGVHINVANSMLHWSCQEMIIVYSRQIKWSASSREVGDLGFWPLSDLSNKPVGYVTMCFLFCSKDPRRDLSLAKLS